MNPLEILREKLAKFLGDVKAIEAKAASEGRVEFSPEEQAALNDIQAQVQAVQTQIGIHEANAALEETVTQPQPRRVEAAAMGPVTTRPSAPGSTSSTSPITGGTLASARSGNFGFTRGPSEFLGAVKNASYGRVDQRLMNAITTYGSEGIGPDGGFAGSPDISRFVTSVVQGEGSLVARMNPTVTAANQITFPTDETTPWGTSGVYAEWLEEAGALTARKPALRQVTCNLKKVGALVHLTDELLQDAPAIQTHVMNKVAAAITAQVNLAIVNGTGVGMPLGLLKAPGLVTVSETASSATIVAADVAMMLARMVPESVNNCFWLMHNSVLPYIWTLTLGQQPIYQPNWQADPYGRLLNRPIVVSEFCQDFNTAGDIMLVSPDGYALAIKNSGIETAYSIHFAFDQALQSFRATMRVGGIPLASAAITRKNGSNTMSHILAMAARS